MISAEYGSYKLVLLDLIHRVSKRSVKNKGFFGSVNNIIRSKAEFMTDNHP